MSAQTTAGDHRTGSKSSVSAEYAQRFAENEIDFSILPDLTTQT